MNVFLINIIAPNNNKSATITKLRSLDPRNTLVTLCYKSFIETHKVLWLSIGQLFRIIGLEAFNDYSNEVLNILKCTWKAFKRDLSALKCNLIHGNATSIKLGTIADGRSVVVQWSYKALSWIDSHHQTLQYRVANLVENLKQHPY